MKLILRVDTDDTSKINIMIEHLKDDIIVLPQGDRMKLYVVSDLGNVTEII